MVVRYSSAALTHVGMKRAQNEDAFLVRDDLGFYAVADGMGGHNAGEVASEVAIESVDNMIRHDVDAIEAYRRAPSGRALARLRRILVRAIESSTYMVFGTAEQDPDRKGMGTTITALLLVDRLALLASVGDSRAYLVRGHRTWQITEDHTVVQLQIKAGLISPEMAKKSARGHVLTRAVGPRDHVQVDVFEVPIEIGDRFVLCSDGLHGYVQLEELAPTLNSSVGIEGGVRALIDMANRRGGKDNITCIITEVSDAARPSEPATPKHARPQRPTAYAIRHPSSAG